MSQNNLVRQNEISTNHKLNREKHENTFDQHANKNKSDVSLWTMKFSNFEKTVVAVSVVIILGLVIAQLGVKNSINGEQQHLQSFTNRVANLKNSNSNLQQEISELQNSGRLNKIAHKAGLSLRNNNVRNVNKWVQK
ncbi:hypothetical protein WR164_10060 [Philodulcilactobacillus myokoensis]|uniref:Cell division protein FtsL n=1 Tax=Philodulcilactobacillus myokoensis TaxID=2929573 RepID=A0A9W6B144_9LACO|nr:hypothetical protein [Philodulcilactobacillus myokoensis]GLB47027.1 hypothetical protein WR164_10060 [Philodulcilactobacillus myokoensis]